MWSNTVSDIVLDYYSNYYLPKERALYEPDIKSIIEAKIPFVLGGKIGLNILFENSENQNESYVLFSNYFVDIARKIADKFYIYSKNPLVAVQTVIPYKHLTVNCGQRNVAEVYTNLTTRRSAVRSKFKLLTGEVVDILVQSPRLYLIAILRDYYDPILFKDRKDNAKKIEMLMDYFDVHSDTHPLVENQGHGNPGAIMPGFLNTILQNPKLRAYIFDHVIAYCANNRLILISDKTIDEETIELTKITANKTAQHEMHLPGDLFVHKCTSYIDKLQINVYNIGYYDLIPFTYNKKNNTKIALPSVTARICMMEDNSGNDLVYNKIIRFYNSIMHEKYIEDALDEVYPEPKNEFFYGQHIDKITLKKHMISNVESGERIRPYYPSLNAKKIE
jgi:hypothetical protein